MKKYVWVAAIADTSEPMEKHTVSCVFRRLTGRITVTIDGEDFRLPAGFLGLGAAKREIFRLGDEQAVLAVEKSGRAQLIFRGETVEPETVEYSLV